MFIYIFVAFVACIVALIWNIINGGPGLSKGQLVRPIPESHSFTDLGPWLSRPLIVRKGLMEWQSAGRLSPGKVLNTFGRDAELFHVFRNTRPNLGPYFDKNAAAARLASLFVDLDRPAMPELYEAVNMSAGQLLDAAFAATDNHDLFHLYSAHVNDNLAKLAPQLVDEMQPFSLLELDPGSSELNANLWLSQAKAITHGHYDSFANLNGQLYGSKRWTLRPPADPSVSVFPFVHPSRAQIRTADAGSSQGLLLVGDTRPGDILFIPAYWFHSVETLTHSTNLNVWTKNSTRDQVSLQIMSRAYEHGFPAFSCSLASCLDERMMNEVTSHLRNRYADPQWCVNSQSSSSSSSSCDAVKKKDANFCFLLNELPSGRESIIIVADALEVSLARGVGRSVEEMCQRIQKI